MGGWAGVEERERGLPRRQSWDVGRSDGERIGSAWIPGRSRPAAPPPFPLTSPGPRPIPGSPPPTRHPPPPQSSQAPKATPATAEVGVGRVDGAGRGGGGRGVAGPDMRVFDEANARVEERARLQGRGQLRLLRLPRPLCTTAPAPARSPVPQPPRQSFRLCPCQAPITRRKLHPWLFHSTVAD